MFTSESGIYIIKNIKNNKAYIGSAVNLKNRESKHISDLKKNKHHSSKLQNSWNKHGSECFFFSVIEYVIDVKSLISKEQYWIDLCDSYKNGYNCSPIAGSVLGTKHSDETKAKMSASRKGHTPNKGKVASEETRAKISAANKGHTRNLGRRCSEETKAKLSGKTHSDETKAKIGAASKGNKYRSGKSDSEETRLKKSASAKGNTNALGSIRTEEEKAKISAFHKGRKVSDETKKRMSESSKGHTRNTGRVQSAAERAKRSVAAKNYCAKKIIEKQMNTILIEKNNGS